MGDIVGVLVVPADGDPGGLLAEGRCSAYPRFPPACAYWRASHQTWCSGGGGHHSGAALPLWWDGALVPEGWDRARRVYLSWCTSNGRTHEREPHFGTAQASDPDWWEMVARVGAELVRAGLASRVVRLTRDEAGRLVEVTP